MSESHSSTKTPEQYHAIHWSSAIHPPKPCQASVYIPSNLVKLTISPHKQLSTNEVDSITHSQESEKD